MSPDTTFTPEEMIAAVNRIMVEEFEAEEEQAFRPLQNGHLPDRLKEMKNI